MTKYTGDLRRDFDRANEIIVEQKDRILGYQERNKELSKALKTAREAKQKQKEEYDSVIAEKDAIIKVLTNEVAHLKAIAGHDGTNTGIPTSATPIGKKKVIPNSRRSSGKAKGGQPGHEKHSMPAFDEDEITEVVTHGLEDEDLICDKCGGSLTDTGEAVCKDEFDVIIKTVKRRHEYHIYECADCGDRVRLEISKAHKEKNQYGSNVQAVALSLMATGNVAINKVRMLISGMTGGEMALSEGFISKLYQKAAATLGTFLAELRVFMIQKNLLYWDDTVIMVKTARACMRFYGDETIAYYTAHQHKDMESLISDDILPVLTEKTTVMHDHNKVNYNDRFCFRNIECNQHLQRDLQKVADDFRGHEWAGKVKGLISSAIKDRKDRISAGEGSFSEEYVASFFRRLDCYLSEGLKESEKDSRPEEQTFEKTLLARIEEYKGNYFLWVKDFKMPTTDNLSERGLRGIKSHMKISGQFDSERTARYYAAVKTYIETCRRNRINEMQALSRLCAGNPYTVAEIFSQ